MAIRTIVLTVCALVAMTMNCLAVEPVKQADHCPITENQLLGYWKGIGDNGFFEEFLVNRDGSDHRFSSWLHQRPAVNGTWVLDNCEFKIAGPIGFTFRVASFKDMTLTLFDVEEQATSVYRWTGKPDMP